MKIFISYCDNDGLGYAEQSSVILESYGHKTWYFDRDKTPGAPRIVDITKHLRHWCDAILFLCTNGSLHSYGQLKEIIQWDSTEKPIIAVPINKARVPELIDGYICTN